MAGGWSIVPVDRGNVGYVPALFRKVYGDEYLHTEVYRPEALWKQIQRGDILAVLAYSPAGLPVGYVALGRLTSNPRLWEEKCLVVAPEYNDSGVAVPLAEYLTKRENHQNIDIEGIFSYAVCYHYFTQIICAKAGWYDCFLMLDYVAKSLYTRQPDTGRVACVMMYTEFTDQTNPVYLPREYAEILCRIAQPLYPRDFRLADKRLPDSNTTVWEDTGHMLAGSWHIAVRDIGADWSDIVSEILAQARLRKIVSLQLILNMACPCIGVAVTILRQQGFFLGGLAPRWFGSDGVLMQMILGKEPDYENIKLYTRTAKDLLVSVRTDQEAVQQLTVQ